MATLWYGGKVRPLTGADVVEEAVVTENGIICDIGNEDELRTCWHGLFSREVNLAGGVMYPGFTDSHLHMIGHGEKLLKLDVSEMTSIEEVTEALKQKAARTPYGSWILAEGFNENLYEGARVPDRTVLDNVSTDHPIMLTRVCRHAMVTNSFGLQLADIHAGVTSPAGGRIERDSSGEPTGYLHDQAQELLKKVLPKVDRGYVQKAMQVSLKDLHRKGITGIHTEDLFYYHDPADTLTLFYDLFQGAQKMRVELLVHHEALEAVQQVKQEHPWVRLNTMKLFADGALGGRTALLSAPYADDPSSTGVAIHTQEGMDQLIRKARRYGMPAAIHVIGDGALEMALDSIEAYPAPQGTRDRLIHLQVTRKDLRERMKKLPVVLDLQPRFVVSDFPWVTDRLGEERMKDSFAWKTLLEEEIRCAGGSDAPIEPVDPLLGIHAAVMRKLPHENHDGWQPEQKLTVTEALRLFTAGAAEAVSAEHTRGTIEKGKCADFTILSEDLYDVPPDEWEARCSVEKTVVDDTVVYERRKQKDSLS
ncbi:amidohydrolase [Alkalicoccus urumqiensis]|uniref:Amidohydrolase n=1 Tax=Alkalicoccus urumqiensis TaxID=1548213 RepID=A0A2P6MD94_ALKUR|nr:amidohydrolase [Alkalicoccus urumqiensis]PRO64242.1 amidohydrolase [Alkalicoccus urumqiensis]